MKDEFIIINKTAIQKRIEELEKQYGLLSNKSDRSLSDIEEEREIVGEQKALATILFQSTPLIPEITLALHQQAMYKQEDIDKYISNLKLDI